MDKENVVYIYNMLLLSHKNNEIMSFAEKRMELKAIMYSEINQTERDK
jgi:hypothetical protein